MNLITHNKAYSIFPRATFEERRSLIHVQHEESAVQAHRKYEKRGWQFITEIDEDEIQNTTSAFADGPRHLGDSKCWTIHLHPELNHSPMFWEANSWRLHYGVHAHPMHAWGLIRRSLHFSYLLDVTLCLWPKPGKYEETVDEQWVNLTAFSYCWFEPILFNQGQRRKICRWDDRSHEKKEVRTDRAGVDDKEIILVNSDPRHWSLYPS